MIDCTKIKMSLIAYLHCDQKSALAVKKYVFKPNPNASLIYVWNACMVDPRHSKVILDQNEHFLLEGLSNFFYFFECSYARRMTA